jgi:hypothetical protein
MADRGGKRQGLSREIAGRVKVTELAEGEVWEREGWRDLGTEGRRDRRSEVGSRRSDQELRGWVWSRE